MSDEVLYPVELKRAAAVAWCDGRKQRGEPLRARFIHPCCRYALRGGRVEVRPPCCDLPPRIVAMRRDRTALRSGEGRPRPGATSPPTALRRGKGQSGQRINQAAPDAGSIA